MKKEGGSDGVQVSVEVAAVEGKDRMQLVEAGRIQSFEAERRMAVAGMHLSSSWIVEQRMGCEALPFAAVVILGWTIMSRRKEHTVELTYLADGEANIEDCPSSIEEKKSTRA